eukprot:TRINITY_DN5352_c0_g1_i1.p1 TRINITY_DN5352_c0_g1~~TRINITY_DN5352_c0_g1_i1.p1  ORF type:complete len:128 (-),score=19.98 TRINITY_DN5352_c0_g1_i1:25-408(-)
MEDSQDQVLFTPGKLSGVLAKAVGDGCRTIMVVTEQGSIIGSAGECHNENAIAALSASSFASMVKDGPLNLMSMFINNTDIQILVSPIETFLMILTASSCSTPAVLSIKAEALAQVLQPMLHDIVNQ